jgi:hypothetical protein
MGQSRSLASRTAAGSALANRSSSRSRRANRPAFASFPLSLQLPCAILNGFHRSPQVRGDKHPRLSGLHKFEQPSILIGVQLLGRRIAPFIFFLQPESQPRERRATITRLSETRSFLSARARTAGTVRSSSVAISLASIPATASERNRSSSSGVHGFDGPGLMRVSLSARSRLAGG